jgi:hypothetical protein
VTSQKGQHLVITLAFTKQVPQSVGYFVFLTMVAASSATSNLNGWKKTINNEVDITRGSSP